MEISNIPGEGAPGGVSSIWVGSDDLGATLVADPGGRLSSLRFCGEELLVANDGDPIAWGAFPMVPFAGRVALGEFSFDGVRHRLPADVGGHAIHGTVWREAWECVDGGVEIGLGRPWPFGGRVRHEVAVAGQTITCRLELTAGDRSMPAMLGWHPWFRRELSRGGPVELSVVAEGAWEVTEDRIPTGEMVGLPGRPWDLPIAGVVQPVQLTWPGVGRLHVTSSCEHWVVYDEPTHAVCVEPQSGVPDDFNREPTVLAPGERLTHTMSLAWRSEA